MKKLMLMVALVCGFAVAGFGGAGNAEAKPKGWHKAKGHHYGYSHGPRRHYGWNRGRHLGWYKHPRHRNAYWRYERW
ncbi:hypothetical protein [Bosea sp. (in: a-proteobacteria)]|uniref:hypothetical protein n=1 Tax=Bosea sp. (in: a-proteobacteria) TaxID=1871050 RepID=UPI002FC9EA64